MSPYKMSHMDGCYPHLYVGDHAAANDEASLINHGITHVINVSPDVKVEIDPAIRVMNIHMDDHYDYAIAKYFAHTNFLIKNTLEDGGGVLVNCSVGISVTIVCAFLIAEEGMSHKDALARVRGARPVAQPNKGFMVQLVQYDKEQRRRRRSGLTALACIY